MAHRHTLARANRSFLAGSAVALVLSSGALAAQTPGSNGGRVASSDSTQRPRVHLRVIGVYDEETGDPIEGADVSDVFTGITSRTTNTGTVAVFFGDTTGTLVRVKKVGYNMTTIPVGTAFSDTTPVTATMIRAGHVLQTVITVGNRSVLLGPADTNQTLLKNGFYERRETGGAPSTAFIDGSKLAATTVVSNARFFGRAICESNLYIDGVKMMVPRRPGRFLKEGVDALVNPEDVAGIETYVTADAPATSVHTVSGPGALDIAGTAAASQVAGAAGTLAGTGCVSFIWLKR